MRNVPVRSRRETSLRKDRFYRPDDEDFQISRSKLTVSTSARSATLHVLMYMLMHASVEATRNGQKSNELPAKPAATR